MIAPGEEYVLTRAASPQFAKPITVRVIRERTDRRTYHGWTWIEAYQLDGRGDATERRELYVMPAGLIRARPTPARDDRVRPDATPPPGSRVGLGSAVPPASRVRHDPTPPPASRVGSGPAVPSAGGVESGPTGTPVGVPTRRVPGR
ncbi:hypothetical protein Vqi01_59080 [Micromonospora qiuiae]|uniref:Uncharacterized protein n=1 Tax=Micromonospora qiuiae TaxID=502268 RepID=A0ABQ4JMD6_9ACTN|nr:hypothetical protein [Micromonospora qiuiae]GIJ30746.1 hypothetical protein Vqi01_59080 [Micromonospora qiuiae]